MKICQSDEEVDCFKEFNGEVKRREQTYTTSLDTFRSISKEIGLIYEVKDLRDELHLIRRVFEDQYQVLEKFTWLFWPYIDDGAKQSRDAYLEGCTTKSLIKRITRLDEDAIRTLEGVSDLLISHNLSLQA